MTQLSYNNIFDAITSNQNEAADLAFRTNMMIAMRQFFQDKHWNQAHVAAKLGIPQPRVSELMTGKINLVSSDKLIGYWAKLGFQFKPVYVPSTPRKAASMKFTVEERAAV